MANTYTLIASNTLSSNQTSIDFAGIPQTYTDLVFRLSLRDTANATVRYTIGYMYDPSGASFSNTQILGSGSAATSARFTGSDGAGGGILSTSADATSSTFSNVEIYIPNYRSTAKKPASIFSASENNATAAGILASASLTDLTSAISRVLFYPNGTGTNFASGSSFFLYGIKNS